VQQGLVIAILVAVIVLLVGLLALLVLAAAGLAWNNRQADKAEALARKKAQERVRKMPARDVPSPTPISRVAGPPPGMDFVDVASADEAATEVMSSRQVAEMFANEEITGTTEVRSLGPTDEGHLQLEDTEETTEVKGDGPGRVVAVKKPG